MALSFLVPGRGRPEGIILEALCVLGCFRMRLLERREKNGYPFTIPPHYPRNTTLRHEQRRWCTRYRYHYVSAITHTLDCLAWLFSHCFVLPWNDASQQSCLTLWKGWHTFKWCNPDKCLFSSPLPKRCHGTEIYSSSLALVLKKDIFDTFAIIKCMRITL